MYLDYTPFKTSSDTDDLTCSTPTLNITECIDIVQEPLQRERC